MFNLILPFFSGMLILQVLFLKVKNGSVNTNCQKKKIKFISVADSVFGICQEKINQKHSAVAVAASSINLVSFYLMTWRQHE